MPLHPAIAVWPESAGVDVRQDLSIEAGDAANVSVVTMDAHSGTHIDAPLHTLAGGAPMSSISLETLNGPAIVISIPGVREITGDDLDRLLPKATTRVLLKTENSAGPIPARFDPDFSALSLDGARCLVDHGIKLIGVDGWSVQRFGGDPEVHNVLLRAGIVLLEGLNLRGVPAGGYRLTCLPLALPTLEAAPARAVLEPLDSDIQERGSAAGSEH